MHNASLLALGFNQMPRSKIGLILLCQKIIRKKAFGGLATQILGHPWGICPNRHHEVRIYAQD